MEQSLLDGFGKVLSTINYARLDTAVNCLPRQFSPYGNSVELKKVFCMKPHDLSNTATSFSKSEASNPTMLNS